MPDRKVILYLAASLDGYIATTDHNLDWLFEVEGEGDNGYSKFAETIDTVIIGRVTYDWVMDQEGRYPYPEMESYVFSRTKQEDTEHLKFVDGEAHELVEQLKQQDGKDIWIVGGGELLQTFLEEGLVDEMMITIAPILLGSGIPLFREQEHQTPLQLIQVNRYKQFVELHYRVGR